MGQVERQSKQFQRYGIWGEFENPYMTLQPAYEASQLEVFGKMFLNGHIYRGKKPVHWSPSSQTALAEAELEYPDVHVSQSVYVAFPIEAILKAKPIKDATLKSTLRRVVKVSRVDDDAVDDAGERRGGHEPKVGIPSVRFQREKIVVANDLVASLSETLEDTLTR